MGGRLFELQNHLFVPVQFDPATFILELFESHFGEGDELTVVAVSNHLRGRSRRLMFVQPLYHQAHRHLEIGRLELRLPPLLILAFGGRCRELMATRMFVFVAKKNWYWVTRFFSVCKRFNAFCRSLNVARKKDRILVRMSAPFAIPTGFEQMKDDGAEFSSKLQHYLNVRYTNVLTGPR